MDRINFLATDDFPVSTNTFDRLQQATAMAAKLAFLGGTNYILSGCSENNGKIEPGMIVIEGEVIPFQGGNKMEKVEIQEIKKTLEAFDQEYPEAYIDRIAVFSNTGQYVWAEFAQVLTNQQLQQRIEAITGDAPGIVKMWSGRIDKIPAEYKLCDGTVLSISDYPDLFEVLGVSFGGDGVNNFALPDIRGRFVVGYNSSNPDYNKISKDNTGGNDQVTLTVKEIPVHDHVNNPLFNKLSAKAGDVDEQRSPGSVDPDNAAKEYNVGGMSDARWVEATIQKVGGGQPHENRPPYFVLAYIIKVR